MFIRVIPFTLYAFATFMPKVLQSIWMKAHREFPPCAHRRCDQTDTRSAKPGDLLHFLLHDFASPTADSTACNKRCGENFS